MDFGTGNNGWGVELSDVINIDVIAAELFNISKFTPKELVKCALVSKKWRGITRKILQKKVNCTISLVLKERREGSNLEKIHWLQNCCSRNFFNTIKIIIPPGSSHRCHHNYKNLLHCLKSTPIVQTNFIGMEIDDDFRHEPSCQAYQVIKLICQMLSSSTIEDVTVRNQSFDSVFRVNRTGRYCFPNAKFIKIRGMPQNPPDYRRILKSYPNLEKVVAGITLSSLVPFVSMGKTHLISVLSLVDVDNFLFEVFLQFAEQRPKLKAIIIHPSDIWFLPGMDEIFGLLFESSRECLETISTTLPVLEQLTESAYSHLTQLQQIDLNYSVGDFEGESLRMISQFKTFPHLTTVEFTMEGFLPIFNEIFNEDYEDLNRLENFSWPSVKKIIFIRFDQNEEVPEGYSLEPSVLRQVAQVFPNVTKFSYQGSAFPISELEFRLTCRGIWRANWEFLESIEIAVDYSELLSFENDIFGIMYEERVHWMELLREGVDLTDMQYAPLEKCIRDCPKLREILISHDGYEEISKDEGLIRAVKHKPGWVRLHPILQY